VSGVGRLCDVASVAVERVANPDTCFGGVSGQIAILEAALECREQLFEEAMAAAKEAGVDMQMEEDGVGEEEEQEGEENESYE